MDWVSHIIDLLGRVRERRPLIQNITNFVVMNTTANALLAIGASPVMSHAPQELEDMLGLADALVINIGTLDKFWIESMYKAAELATDMGKPIVLDPVGSGATRLRTEVSLNLLRRYNISVVRGNFSEMASLLGSSVRTRGVDTSTYSREHAKKISVEVAREFGLVAAVTGPTDYISDGDIVLWTSNGHPMLGRVTGTGCIATALIGAFIAVSDPLDAGLSALTIFGIAAEKAFEEAMGPGTFHVKLYDWLYRIDGDLIRERAEVGSFEAEG